jgi:hypothetical protein
MATTSFGEAMAGFADSLYARAKERMADRRTQLLSGPRARANARARVAFEVKLGPQGAADVSVNKYCAGYALHCTAWLESSHPATVVSGFLRSSDGGGSDFTRLRPEQRLQFRMETGFWRSTTFTVHLQTVPALPEGTVLEVCMDIDY